ncbi:S-layer homology domain-containing protein, partial [Leptolyngbya sp. FACHB-36]|uniref:S-layer homology domain-containing protein n=1 Tax=Leptolyngbya sp. FACHB-36 TaxID=2692808 RepID=UPI001681A771
MSYSNSWKSGTAVLVALGLVTGTAAPIVMTAPAVAQTAFPDVPSNYWASSFIQELVTRQVIAGFPDGTFRPEEPVTRAQFASMIRKAFSRQAIRNPAQFNDVPSNYWAAAAIQEAYSTGFLAGYPDGSFRPNENIPRAQVLVSLANGLNYAATGTVDNVLVAYNDAASIPGYARPSIAAATERRIVVNYPDVRTLSPNQTATRAEVAAFIYQALVSSGQVAAINSPYIVGQATAPQAVRIPAGTAIPVRYEQAERILLAKNEPKPAPLTLKVAQNIVTSNGAVLIPAGSDVVGELRTVQGGAQFVASQIVLANGQQIPVSANSEVITRTETVRRGATTGKILTSTVVGAGAAAAIAGVTGDRTIKAEEVLGGAAVGALASAILGRDRTELIA